MADQTQGSNNVRLVLEAVNRTNENFDQVLALMREVVRMAQVVTQANQTIAQSTAALAAQNAKLSASYSAQRQQINTLAQTTQQYQRILQAQHGTQQQITGSTNGMNLSFGRLKALLATLGVIEVGRQMVEANIQIQRITNSLEAVTGRGAPAAEAMRYLRTQAERLGLYLPVIALEYTKMVAAAKPLGFTTTEIRDIFESVTEAAVVMGLSMEDVHGTLRALQQMMNKGTIQAEELRGQLGERLPGALPLMARGLGVTTKELQKLLDTGSLLSKDALPALARELRATYGDQVQQATDTTARNLDRLKNSLFELKNSLNDAGFIDKFVSALDVLTQGIKRMDEAVRILGGTEGQGFEKQGQQLINQSKNLRSLQQLLEVRNQILILLRTQDRAASEGDNLLSKSTALGLYNTLQNLNVSAALMNEKEAMRLQIAGQQAKVYKEQLATAEKLVKKFAEINSQFRSAVYGNLPAGENASLQDSLAAKQAEVRAQAARTSEAGTAFNAATDPKKRSELLTLFAAELAKELQLRTEALGIEKEIAKVSAKITTDTKEQLADEQRKNKEAQTKIEQDQRITQLNNQAEAEDRLYALRDARARLEANQKVFETDRIAARIKLLQQERTALDALIATKQKDLSDVIGRPSDTNTDELQKTQAIIALKRDLNQLEKDRTAILIEQQNQQTTLFGAIQTSMVQWVNQLGTTSQQIANVLTSTLSNAIGTVSSNIADAIIGTQTWSEAWNNLVINIVRGLIQMVIQFGLQQAAMFAIRLIYGKSALIAATSEAAAAAAIWTPAAVAASTATFGGAAAMGLSSVIASMAIGQGVAAGLAIGGSAFGGARKGGYTGAGASGDIAGAVHRREFVFPADVVDRVGPDALFRLMQGIRSGDSTSDALGEINSRSTFTPTGPIVPQVSVTSAPAKVVILTNPKQYEEFLRSPEGRDITLAHVGQNLNTLGLKS